MNSTRKQNGEGSVFQVSENKWVAKIRLGQLPNGKQNVKQFSGKTEAIVKKKLKEFKSSMYYEQKQKPFEKTVQHCFSMWLKEYQFNKLKPSSYDRLESTVNNHILPNLGNIKIDKVTRDDIQSLINKLYYTYNLSYSSVKKVYVALNACFNHYLIDDVVIKNPCMGIVLPNPQEKTKQVIAFSPSEVKQLKDELKKQDGYGNTLYYYGNAFLLILNTGLRMGEALALTWSDVDFENMAISITQNCILTKKRDETGCLTGGYDLKLQNSTKTINGNRVIPLNNTAVKALLALKENNNSAFVIANNKQKQVLPSNFERSFHKVLSNAGFKKCGVHTLRHTFASMMFRNGVDIKIISSLLGHSTVKITYDTYVHLLEQDISEVTSVLDKDMV